ncbi:amine oxidase [Ilyonectria destructans]|nr:amine oxidase [Ilyonectria destructans]
MQDGAQQQIIRGGGQAIADALHKELGDAVRLHEPVVAVDQTGSDYAIIKTTKGVFSCSRVIMTIPLPLVSKVDFSPALPAPKKVFASYDTPFWQQNGLRGEVVGVDSYVMLVNDVSPEDASRGVLMGSIAGMKALEFLSMNQDQRLAIIMKELEKCYGAAALKPKKLTLHTMTEEKWSTGCPLASPAPGIWTTLGEWLCKPIGRIHWAGTETAEVWNGYMEGAVNSGLRAAREVLDELE